MFPGSGYSGVISSGDKDFASLRPRIEEAAIRVEAIPHVVLMERMEGLEIEGIGRRFDVTLEVCQGEESLCAALRRQGDDEFNMCSRSCAFYVLSFGESHIPSSIRNGAIPQSQSHQIRGSSCLPFFGECSWLWEGLPLRIL